MDTVQSTEQAIDSPALSAMGISGTHVHHGFGGDTIFLHTKGVGVSYFGPQIPETIMSAGALLGSVKIEQNSERLRVSGTTPQGQKFTLTVVFEEE